MGRNDALEGRGKAGAWARGRIGGGGCKKGIATRCPSEFAWSRGSELWGWAWALRTCCFLENATHASGASENITGGEAKVVNREIKPAWKLTRRSFECEVDGACMGVEGRRERDHDVGN